MRAFVKVNGNFFVLITAREAKVMFSVCLLIRGVSVVPNFATRCATGWVPEFWFLEFWVFWSSWGGGSSGSKSGVSSSTTSGGRGSWKIYEYFPIIFRGGGSRKNFFGGVKKQKILKIFFGQKCFLWGAKVFILKKKKKKNFCHKTFSFCNFFWEGKMIFHIFFFCKKNIFFGGGFFFGGTRSRARSEPTGSRLGRRGGGVGDTPLAVMQEDCLVNEYKCTDLSCCFLNAASANYHPYHSTISIRSNLQNGFYS